MLARPVLFSGRNTSRILRVDPTGLTLPTLTVNKVYGLNAAGNIELGDASTSLLILGFYVGNDAGGYMQFEQDRVQIAAAFTSRGTRWYLSTNGDISAVATAVEIGVAIDADSLLITGDRVLGGGAITGIDVQDVIGGVATNVQVINLDTDAPDDVPFASVVENPAGVALLSIDKQTDFDLAQALVPTPTGFDFSIAQYRAVEVFYLLTIEGDIFETGSIYILHNGTVAGVRVDLHDLTLQGDPPSGITFSADVNGGQCRLLYEQPADLDFVLSLKPRAMVNVPTPVGGGGEA